MMFSKGFPLRVVKPDIVYLRLKPFGHALEGFLLQLHLEENIVQLHSKDLHGCTDHSNMTSLKLQTASYKQYKNFTSKCRFNS